MYFIRNYTRRCTYYKPCYFENVKMTINRAETRSAVHCCLCVCVLLRFLSPIATMNPNQNNVQSEDSKGFCCPIKSLVGVMDVQPSQ